ncbi:MAG TPA: hypothetical protein VF158_14465 [Longimicrobiales bacterium]
MEQDVTTSPEWIEEMKWRIREHAARRLEVAERIAAGLAASPRALGRWELAETALELADNLLAAHTQRLKRELCEAEGGTQEERKAE